MLGTAQLGICRGIDNKPGYGIANRQGYPSDIEAQSILELAVTSGITWFDTARSYGSAEARLATVLDRHPTEEIRVITKLPPLSSLGDSASRAEINRFIEDSVFQSRGALHRSRLDVVMFHRSADMFRWRGAALDCLARMVEQAIIGEVGASVYSPEEAIRCIRDPTIKHLQMPFNLLDRRWFQERIVNAINQRPELRIHARSVFLQGLLVSDSAVWPSWAKSSESIVDWIAGLTIGLKRRSAADLCMAYVRAFPWVASLVLGVETQDQLEQLISYSLERPLSSREVQEIHRFSPDISEPERERLLNPARW